MTVISKIVKARGGNLIVDIQNQKSKIKSAEDAAKKFGLYCATNIYFKIDATRAKEVLVSVLSKDMAYGTELMPRNLASTLATDFISEFSNESSHFYTNGNYGQPSKSTVCHSWTPATSATFDTGILVLSKNRIGCAWFMDED